ncbi:hypothetical protein HNR26_003794 [Rhizobium rosettiformans]|uniref:Uncharacterized protein n=2 Tax=Rhizobium rosettiformans TaxID=1368430 RepID=A0A4S8PQ11_9HYPH|nr:hypothetical protein [Rhizobium rosettiformans]MBB5277713.1 hypothetical protein [Rhizobium rosettiformans]THV33077.1 hypothetical protein FAA86_17950 [Rhizobium rosettiformans W3]
MTNVVPFPASCRIEISYGRLVRTVIIDANGYRPSPHDRGQELFFVEAVEPNSRILMWSGSSYDEAMQQARDLGSEFGPILDLVVVA